jgi:hypothetical protein
MTVPNKFTSPDRRDPAPFRTCPVSSTGIPPAPVRRTVPDTVPVGGDSIFAKRKEIIKSVRLCLRRRKKDETYQESYHHYFVHYLPLLAGDLPHFLVQWIKIQLWVHPEKDV